MFGLNKSRNIHTHRGRERLRCGRRIFRYRYNDLVFNMGAMQIRVYTDYTQELIKVLKFPQNS